MKIMEHWKYLSISGRDIDKIGFWFLVSDYEKRIKMNKNVYLELNENR